MTFFKQQHVHEARSMWHAFLEQIFVGVFASRKCCCLWPMRELGYFTVTASLPTQTCLPQTDNPLITKDNFLAASEDRDVECDRRQEDNSGGLDENKPARVPGDKLTAKASINLPTWQDTSLSCTRERGMPRTRPIYSLYNIIYIQTGAWRTSHWEGWNEIRPIPISSSISIELISDKGMFSETR